MPEGNLYELSMPLEEFRRCVSVVRFDGALIVAAVTRRGVDIAKLIEEGATVELEGDTVVVTRQLA